jgi:3-methyladenine DNA glycosylase Mpg
MKIRIKGNSLRYRLTKRDVDQFLKEGYLEETTNFGNRQLIYALQRNGQDNITASFQNNKITLNMPATLATEWAQTERVGFDGQDNELYLLIEKDFKCLDNVAEDQSDNYPNPLAFQK